MIFATMLMSDAVFIYFSCNVWVRFWYCGYANFIKKFIKFFLFLYCFSLCRLGIIPFLNVKPSGLGDDVCVCEMIFNYEYNSFSRFRDNETFYFFL